MVNIHPHGLHLCSCPACGYQTEVEEYTQCNTLPCPVCGNRLRAVERGEYGIAKGQTMEAALTPPRAGPKVLGSRVSLAAGAYTDIVSIIAPSEAAPGQTVDLQVKVKNLADYNIYISTSAKYDDTIFYLSPEYASVDAYATYTFYGSFTMPNKSVRVYVWSYYWTGSEWYLDDSEYFDISLAEAYAGKITKMELEHDGTYSNIPAYDIPQHERGLVHITGRNDTSKAQRMGIHWQVKDPQGVTKEDYYAWESWPYTGAGSTHEFIGDRFNLDKVGNYSLSVELLMNYDNPEIVDSYSGMLCRVVAVVPEPEFQGFAISRFDKV
ncbi:hypothetical protein ES703_110628 [subsurface metagenome]